MFRISEVFLLSSLGAFLLISRELLQWFRWLPRLFSQESWMLFFNGDYIDIFLNPHPSLGMWFRKLVWLTHGYYWSSDTVIGTPIVLLPFIFLLFLAFFLYSLWKTPKAERKRQSLSKPEFAFSILSPFFILFVEIIRPEIIFPYVDKIGHEILTQTELFLVGSYGSFVLTIVTVPFFVAIFRRVLINRWLVLFLTILFLLPQAGLLTQWIHLGIYALNSSVYAINLGILLAMTFRAFFPAKPKCEKVSSI